ncbi:MAG: hypothetical protein IJY94_07355 [Clostridia bacterium]|nr:hypothetical protein [Clostridia bacterium]
MKENEFLDGVSNIDSDIVERFVSMDNRLKRKSSKRSIWVRVGALAACFALIASVVLSVISNIVPIWNTAHYSASDIAKLSPGYKAFGGTNAYKTIYVPDEKYLYVNEIPNIKYLPIYKYSDGTKSSKKELKKFFNGFIAELSKSLGIDTPTYSVKKDTEDDELYTSGEKMGKYSYSLRQDKTSNTFWFSNLYSDDNNCEIVLDGETVQIDQRLSDEEILRSLESIKNKLFDIFGVSFKDAKIVRTFGGSLTHGAKRIDVYFYSEDAHPLNKYMTEPVSDCIQILFDNYKNSSNDIVSDSILTDACIYYVKNRVAVSTTYDHIANAKRISLKEAEKLLYKGYVFGGHNCPLCMATQDKVNFEEYEYVDIEYLSNPDYTSIVIPFYAFYKKTFTYYSNGQPITIYAKTYVPAIQVSGYEEYFESQAANHR